MLLAILVFYHNYYKELDRAEAKHYHLDDWDKKELFEHALSWAIIAGILDLGFIVTIIMCIWTFHS